jgi:hypothetical protein
MPDLTTIELTEWEAWKALSDLIEWGESRRVEKILAEISEKLPRREAAE